MSSKGSDDQTEHKRVTYVESVHSFIDSHIQLIRNSIFVLGGLGVVIAVRGLYLSRVFTRIEDIPTSFVKKRVRLRGRVKKITDDDVLGIDHIPVFQPRFPFTKETKRNEYLPVHLACIDLSPDGRLWMKDNVLDQIVWFHLLHRSLPEIGNQSKLYSRIELPKTFRQNIYVNEELVEKGLARISLSTIEEISGVQDNPHFMKYLDKLIKLEDKASKKGRGMWLKSFDDSWGKKGLSMLKYVALSPFKFMKWIYTKRKKGDS